MTSKPNHIRGDQTAADSAAAGVRPRSRLLSGIFSKVSDRIAHIALEMDAADANRAATLATELVKLGEKASGQDAWDELALRLDKLSPTHRERVLAAGAATPGRWGAAAQRLSLSPSTSRRLAAARLAELSQHPDAILSLPTLLADTDAAVADAATAALLSLVRACTTGVGCAREVVAALQSALRQSLDTFDAHRRRETLLAAFDMLATPARRSAAGAPLASWLVLDDHIAHLPARAAMRAASSSEPSASARAAMVLLTSPALRAACAERLLGASTQTDIDELLESSHLLASPIRRGKWQDAVESHQTKAKALFADVKFIEPVSDRAARRVAPALAAAQSQPAWNAAVGLLIDPRAHVRASLVRAVINAPRAACVADVLIDASLDSSASVARTAFLGATSPGHRDALSRETLRKLCLSLARSPHAQLRELAEHAAGGLDAWSPSLSTSRIHARRMLRRDRAGFVLALRERAIQGLAEQRISAIRLAASLRLADELEHDLASIIRASLRPLSAAAVDLQRDEELRVVATAASALGTSHGQLGEDALVSACAHADARIRANALDAIWQRLRRISAKNRSADLVSSVIEFKNDSHHRVRASAIRAELSLPEPPGRRDPSSQRLQSLVAPMLSDPRPLHRVAGLWLAERAASSIEPGRTDRTPSQLPMGAVSSLVAAMINTDPSVEVRRRARRCAQRLLARAAV